MFCFKQKTAYEMRISDWSSDVCSSDLPGAWRERQGGRWPGLGSGAGAQACPCHRIPHAAWWSARPGCVRYLGVEPLFEQTGGGAMRLETGCIDHQLIRASALHGYFRSNALEHTKPASSE